MEYKHPKKNKEKQFKPIYKTDLIDTNDKITKKEKKKIKRGIKGNGPKDKKLRKETYKKWEKGFKK